MVVVMASLLFSQALPFRVQAAVEAITADPENAWAVSTYGGVLILIGRHYREDEQ
jgi:hypothetical protein